MLKSRLNGAIYFAALATFFGAASLYRFWPWMPQVFAGDDLIAYSLYLKGQFANGPWASLSTGPLDKYRPVFLLFLGPQFRFFGLNVQAYEYCNLALNVANAMLLYKILRTQTLPRSVAIACALAVCTSRFSLFQVTQIVGSLEGLGFTFFLGVVLGVVKCQEPMGKTDSERPMYALLAVASSALAIHTHERYLVLLPWLGLVFWMSAKTRRPRRALSYVLLCASLILFNLGLKRLLHISVNAGTAGTSLKFDLASAGALLREALRSIFQMNSGPSHLAALALNKRDHFGAWSLALLFGGLYVILLLCPLSFKRARRSLNRKILAGYFSLFGLLLALLVPPILTIRIEPRWLVEPFALLFVIGASGLVRARPPARRLACVCLGGLALISMSMDTYISPHFSSLSLVSSATFARAFREKILGTDSEGPKTIVLMSDRQNCGWVLGQDFFIRLYGHSETSLSCADTFAEISIRDGRESDVYSIGERGLVLDVTESFRRDVETRAATKFDFILNSAKAKIRSDFSRSVERYKTTLGFQDVLMGEPSSSFRFDKIFIPRHAKLFYGTAMITDTTANTRIKVITPRRREFVVYDHAVGPRVDPSFLFASHDEIDLFRFAGQTVSLVFEIYRGGPDASGSVAVTELKLIH